MWFHLFTGNHDEIGQPTLHDMATWIEGGLIDLGHEVSIGDYIAPNALNVIWENFRDSDIEIFNNLDFKFGLIMTEISVRNTFNFLDQEPWLTRRRLFDNLTRRAQFVWSMTEEAVANYRQWVPTGYLELGFTERFVDPVFAQKPEIDFGFYGLAIAPYRNSVLHRLREHCTIATPDRFLTGRDLSAFIASFKVGICLKHLPQWTTHSSTRLGRLLHAKRGIAAEYVPVQTRASALASMAAEGQDFVEFCLDCLQDSWQQRAEDAYERFRTSMPMKQIMERLLDETVSATPLSPSPLSSFDNGKRDNTLFEMGRERLLHGDAARASGKTNFLVDVN